MSMSARDNALHTFRHTRNYATNVLGLMTDKTEAAIAAKNVSLDVALENLCTLDGRVQVDYVHDDAPDELRNEIQVIQVKSKNEKGKCN